MSSDATELSRALTAADAALAGGGTVPGDAAKLPAGLDLSDGGGATIGLAGRTREALLGLANALRRIETGDYGWCEMTGEPISLQRLEARPIATMTIEAQERHERREKVHRDD